MDYTQIVGAVDFDSVLLGIGAVAAVFAVVKSQKWAAALLLKFLKS